MRMRKSLMKPYNLKRRVPAKDNEGNSYNTWDEAVEIEAAIWSASGRIQAEMYGERLKYIKNMQYDGTETMQEGDGICVYVGPESNPDYKIISIKPDYSPLEMELERI